MDQICKERGVTVARKSSKKGFTAIEVIVVLIVGLGIIALSASNIDKLFGGSTMTAELSNINTMAANIKSLKTSAGYANADTTNFLAVPLRGVNGVPSNMLYSGGTITNGWGGSVTVQTADATGAANSTTVSQPGFMITYNRVPQAACVRLGNQAVSSGTFAIIRADATASTTLTASNSATACVAGDNRMTFFVAS